MGCIIIATPELSDAAVITAGVESAAGPASNLQKRQPTDVWESASATPYCEVDLNTVKTFNLISLLFTNATGFDQWKIRTADTQAGLISAPDYDSTFMTLSYVGSDGHVFVWIPAGLSNRWVRFDFITASNPFMAGRLYIANALQPTRNRSYGMEDGYDDNSAIDMTDGTAMIPNDGTNRAVLNFTLNLITEAERHAIREINKIRGASYDVIVITNPEATVNKEDVLYYGLLQSRRLAVNTAFNFNEIAYQLKAL